MKNLIAYIDESGNSGVQIFKGSEKYYWVGIMLTESDLEAKKTQIIELANSVGFNELHGSEMGFSNIETISIELLNIINEIDARFLFTRIEKEHVATMKFVDIIFDSDNNPNVPNHMYNVYFFGYF